MAGTIAHLRTYDDYIGARTVQRAFEYTGPTSYATGGDGSIKSQVGLVDITSYRIMPIASASLSALQVEAKYDCIYDHLNDKLIILTLSTAPPVEVVNTTDVSDGKWRVVFYGT